MRSFILFHFKYLISYFINVLSCNSKLLIVHVILIYFSLIRRTEPENQASRHSTLFQCSKLQNSRTWSRSIDHIYTWLQTIQTRHLLISSYSFEHKTNKNQKHPMILPCNVPLGFGCFRNAKEKLAYPISLRWNAWSSIGLTWFDVVHLLTNTAQHTTWRFNVNPYNYKAEKSKLYV